MVAVPQESRVLFTLLVNAFSLLLEFALDLTNPFTGRYKVRTLHLVTIVLHMHHSQSLSQCISHLRKDLTEVTQTGSLHTHVRCCLDAVVLVLVFTVRTDLLTTLYSVCVTDAVAGEAHYCYSLPYQDQK
jgi:hypothetical protein